MKMNKETMFGISQTAFRISELSKEVYEAPVMEAVEVKIEQGFQMSASTSYYDPLKEVYR